MLAPQPLPTFLGTAGLPAYPWFLFEAPGESLLPLSPFSPSLEIARAQRSRCHFDAALAWYREAFNPLQQDCTWIHCASEAPDTAVPPTRGGTGLGSGCCDSTLISCDQARDRSVVLHYLDTLVEWSDAVTRRGESSEAYQQSRVILDAASMILGKRPITVQLPNPTTTPPVSEFVPAFRR